MDEPLLSLAAYEEALASLRKAEQIFSSGLDKVAKTSNGQPSEGGEDHAIAKELLSLLIRVATQAQRLERAQKVAKNN
ncbi:MAG TPA: hypothetical protein VGR78_01415 [Verrucomicrobiae bacterium]|nr:hypothetical protein [Verrucomicrobiae bacterium]